MEFNMGGRKFNLDDNLIAKYRKAVGFLPEMKTDEKWLEMIFCTAFKEPAERVLKECPTPILEKELNEAIDFEAEQYLAQGGGIFE